MTKETAIFDEPAGVVVAEGVVVVGSGSLEAVVVVALVVEDSV